MPTDVGESADWADPDQIAPPPPMTRRQLLDLRRAAEQEQAERGGVERGAVERGAVERGAVERGAVEHADVERSATERRPRAGGEPVRPADLEGARPSHWPAPRLSAIVLGVASVVICATAAGRAFGAPAEQISAAAETKGVAAVLQLDPRVSTSAVASALRMGVSDVLPEGLRASRSIDRPVLPGCTGAVPEPHYANGHVPAGELCALAFAPGHHLRSDAAVALARLNIAYRARFGHNVCLTDSYRDVAQQESLAARKPGLAARPGTSEHGMGLAVDFCDGVQNFGSTQYDWMRANAPAFGWDNPAWAIPPSSREEPWHWEYVVGEALTAKGV